jgi:hypothetical protein
MPAQGCPSIVHAFGAEARVTPLTWKLSRTEPPGKIHRVASSGTKVQVASFCRAVAPDTADTELAGGGTVMVPGFGDDDGAAVAEHQQTGVLPAEMCRPRIASGEEGG